MLRPVREREGEHIQSDTALSRSHSGSSLEDVHSVPERIESSVKGSIRRLASCIKAITPGVAAAHAFDLKGNDIIIRLPNPVAIVNNVRNLVNRRSANHIPVAALDIWDTNRHITRHGVHSSREYQEEEDREDYASRGGNGPRAPVAVELPRESVRGEERRLLVEEDGPEGCVRDGRFGHFNGDMG